MKGQSTVLIMLVPRLDLQVEGIKRENMKARL